MMRKAIALLLILGLALPAVAFGADTEPVRKVAASDNSNDIWRDLSSGLLLGALLGGSINQIGQMDDMAAMITSGAAIGVLAGLVFHYSGRGSILTIENEQYRIAMPVVLPTYQLNKGRDELGIRTSLLTVNY